MHNSTNALQTVITIQLTFRVCFDMISIIISSTCIHDGMDMKFPSSHLIHTYVYNWVILDVIFAQTIIPGVVATCVCLRGSESHVRERT